MQMTKSFCNLKRVVVKKRDYGIVWRAEWVEHLLRVWTVSGLNHSRVKSQIEKLTCVASLVSVHHLKPRAGLVVRVSV